MAPSLLKTKLLVPQVRDTVVARLHLFALLDQYTQNQLTLISAPAGFGKSTLISAWAHHKRHELAWLSVDENDNDPSRFLTYLIEALQGSVNGSKGFADTSRKLLQSSQTPLFNEILTHLLNDIAEVPQDIILVLDDYQTINNEKVDQLVTFTLDHTPPNFHLIISSRDDPQFPTAKLRARGQMGEIRATNLRFLPEEVIEFVNQKMGLDLTPENIAELEERTEGWIAGLQLAVISLQGVDDPGAKISDFSGSHRFILDYLIEEVLNKQAPEMQEFLLKTSILERLCAGLCNAVTNRKDSQQILEQLDHANLFIIPLDNERNWYRFHHLFRELLLQRFNQLYDSERKGLLRTAGNWCAFAEQDDQAIEYLLHAEDFKNAIERIDLQIQDAWKRGEDVKLKRWINDLPMELIYENPQLSVFQAWNLFTQGKYEQADQFLQTAEIRFGVKNSGTKDDKKQPVTKLSASARKFFLGGADTMRAFMAFYRNEPENIIQHANSALENLPRDNIAWRNTAIIALGDAHIIRGEMEKARLARIQAMKIIRPEDDIYHYIIAGNKLVITLRDQGKLQEAIEQCERLMDMVEEYGLARTDFTGMLYSVWGEILAELNQLDIAKEYALQGIELADNSTDEPMRCWGYICLTRVLFSQGEFDQVQNTINTIMKCLDRSYVPSWFRRITEDWQVRLWLAQKNVDRVRLWAQNHQADLKADLAYQDHIFYQTMARAYIFDNRFKDARQILQQLVEPAQAGHHTSRLVQVWILVALSYFLEGDEQEGNQALEIALTTARPYKFIRTFTDEGEVMEHILQTYRPESEVLKSYTNTLLLSFKTQAGMPLDPASQPLIEPLSERELEVLDLIAKGLTNQQIAEKLFLSLNTIKVHTRNIYQKLGVNSRTKAIAEARSKQIIAPE